jgi:TonB-linked SusC/RagA family outer membrane protein
MNLYVCPKASTRRVLTKQLLVMKLTLVLLVGFLLNAQGNGFSQTITLSAKNIPLEKVFPVIKKQTGYLVFYNEDLLENARRITINVKNEDLETVLGLIFRDQPLGYFIENKTIVITKKTFFPEAKVPEVTQADTTREVRGTVRNERGEPLPGASVVVTGTSTGSSADAAGNFMLRVPDNRSELTISFIGYSSQQVTIGVSNRVTVVLQEAASSVDDIVVVGYGSVKKSDLTGAVARVNSKELQQRPAFSIEQELAGRAAGVNVSTNSGRPGGRTAVRIRGFNSIQASNNPLYVVDGVIFTGDISMIDPSDIESIDILKDASATAIYGTRGSNGVIIISTKKIRKGGQINYNAFTSYNYLPRKIDVLDTKGFMQVEETSYQNAYKYDTAGFLAGKYEDPIEKRKRYIENNPYGNKVLFKLDANGIPQPLYDVDWQDETISSAFSQGHNLSFTGGDEKASYGLFLGYNDEQGIVKGSYGKRYSARVKLDRQMKSWLKVGANLNYVANRQRRSDAKTGSNDVLRQMVEMVPFIPYKYPDGTYGSRAQYAGLEEGDNPLAQTYEDHNHFNTNSFIGNAYAAIDIIRDLQFTSTAGINIDNINNPYYNSNASLIVPSNRASVTNRQTNFFQVSNRLNYARAINDHHSFDLLAGIEFLKFNSYQTIITTSNFPEDYYLWYNLGAGATPSTPSSAYNAYQMVSYFGRINYNLLNKYLFTVTGRSDGSSRFGENNKFAFFPSAAFAWKVSEEKFMSGLTSVSNLKFRLTYGLTGNSEIGSYLSQSNLRSVSYPFGGANSTGTIIQTLPNPLLKWEKTGQVNLGIDLGLFNDRISVEADVYHKTTKNLLLAAPVPTSSGYATQTKNVGSMENKGLDLSISTRNIQHGAFTWSTTFIFSTFKNRITKLGDKNEDIILNPWEALILRVGNPISSFWGYRREGVWGTDEKNLAESYGLLPGDLKMGDLNKDGIWNSEDKTIIGSGLPKYYGTLSNTFRYRNFDLILELQYSYGNDILMQMLATGESRQGLANSFATVLDAWTPEKQGGYIAEVRPAGAGFISEVDSYLVRDGSFLRGKNLSLAYNLPVSLNSRLGLNNARIFLSFQNFFLLTKYTGYDPEVTTWDDPFAQGMSFYDYPKPRTVMLGLNVNF